MHTNQRQSTLMILQEAYRKWHIIADRSQYNRQIDRRALLSLCLQGFERVSFKQRKPAQRNHQIMPAVDRVFVLHLPTQVVFLRPGRVS